jgi:plasmid stabilization system protein ParE
VTATLIVQPEAEADLGEAFRWYEARRAGLGQEFLEEVSRAFARVTEQPLRYVVVHRGAGRAPLRRFPYAVLYVARGERIFVLAVLHQRRSPRIAGSRVRDFGPE